jgi:CheY-like chemotaxis protein
MGVKDKAPRVLVVDDNQANRDVLADWLLPLGFQVVKASSGREGLDKAAELRPDAVIVDLFMPEMDGLEMIRRLRSTRGARPAIIAASASVREKDQQKSLEAGGDAFLPKPVDLDLLCEQLQGLLGLEWRYQLAPAASAPGPGELIWPSEEVLRALLDSTRMGDVSQLREQLDGMIQADERLEPFVTQLQQLAQQFEFNAILALLQEHLES